MTVFCCLHAKDILLMFVHSMRAPVVIKTPQAVKEKLQLLEVSRFVLE